MSAVSAVGMFLHRAYAWAGGRWPTLAGFGLVAAVAATMLVFVDANIPYNDDEFILFHIVRCSLYPASDVGDGFCNDLMLDLYGSAITVPLRVYHYSGSFPVLYYMPLFLLLRDTIAVRLSGLAGLLFGALLAARVHRLPAWAVMLFVLLIFPYAYQHLVDTGPVAVTTLLFFLSYATIASWMRSPRAWLLYALAVLLFCGVWTKLTFLWYAPVIASFVAYALFVRRPSIRSFLPHAVGSAAVFLALASVVFLATSPGNPSSRPYLDQVINAQSRSLAEIASGSWMNLSLWQAMTNPLEAAQRTFLVGRPELPGIAYSAILYSLPLLSLALLYRSNARVARHALLSFGAYALFLLTAFFILRSKEAWAMHHFILSYPLLILSYLFLYEAARSRMGAGSVAIARMVIAGCFVLLALSTIFFFRQVLAKPMHETEHPSKVALNALLQDEALGEEYVYVVGNWGMMFYQGLFGPSKQSVVWKVYGISPQELGTFAVKAHARGRKVLLLHLWHNGAAPIARETLGAVTCGKDGDVWVATAEPGENLRRVFGECR